MDDHLLNATYYSPELEEPLESTAMLGNIQHSDSPNHVETAASVGKSTVYLCTQSHYLYLEKSRGERFISKISEIWTGFGSVDNTEKKLGRL